MRKFKLLCLLTLASLVACNVVMPAARQDDPNNIYAVTNVTVLDVQNGTAIPAQTVLIVSDRIDEIGAQGTVEIPPDAAIIDGQGLYLMPGLVDAHVHYFDAPVFGRLMIANGVLLVRDMGMPNEFILKMRDELNKGKTPGPEMFATGAILDGDPPLIPLISLGGIDTPEAGRAAVRQQAKAGVDMIKTYSRLTKSTFMAIVDEAHKRNLKVAAHLSESVYLEDAVAAGLDSSEHFNGFEKVIANLLGEPVKLYFHGQAADAGYLARLDEVDPGELQAVYQRLHESGITFARRWSPLRRSPILPPS